jgi:chitin disaccharide deacetylase
MLIINADDFGLSEDTTDRIMDCFHRGSIKSTSAMVFMQDSLRAADLAMASGLEVGLHINFSSAYQAVDVSQEVRNQHDPIVSFLTKNKYNLILYHPFLKKQFENDFKEQLRAYRKIYHRNPLHFDGHHHMHLCSNMLFSSLIPKGTPVRRSFTFNSKEKSYINQIYRKLVDIKLKNRYICTDYFYSINPLSIERLKGIIELSKRGRVELMVHPGRPEEYDFLISREFQRLIGDIPICTPSQMI